VDSGGFWWTPRSARLVTVWSWPLLGSCPRAGRDPAAAGDISVCHRECVCSIYIGIIARLVTSVCAARPGSRVEADVAAPAVRAIARGATLCAGASATIGAAAVMDVVCCTVDYWRESSFSTTPK